VLAIFVRGPGQRLWSVALDHGEVRVLRDAPRPAEAEGSITSVAKLGQ